MALSSRTASTNRAAPEQRSKSGLILPRTAGMVLLVVSAALVIGILVWQAVTANGNPNPTAGNLSPVAAVIDTGVLVFREGLEAILVLAAVTASLARRQPKYGKPVATGAGLAFLATVVTWFVVVALISTINVPALDIQAATGLLAIVVLLVIMNWFFHKIYWTGWISHHNRRGRQLSDSPSEEPSRAYTGLILLGFTAIYREGFEIVLFLQNLRLQVGSRAVADGALIGLFLTALVAVLTFAAHQHLPYKKMLVLTGVMLGAVLLVMVGESIQEMQQAGWIGTTSMGMNLPDWIGVWFAVFPNWEGVLAQLAAGVAVLGSYFAAEHWRELRERVGR